MQKLVHHGNSHSRLKTSGNFSDTRRERALAAAWEALNKRSLNGQGAAPMLEQLFPDATQRDAEVAATVVQWLGSQIGFHFLNDALQNAGLKIAEAGAKEVKTAVKKGVPLLRRVA